MVQFGPELWGCHLFFLFFFPVELYAPLKTKNTTLIWYENTFLWCFRRGNTCFHLCFLQNKIKKTLLTACLLWSPLSINAVAMETGWFSWVLWSAHMGHPGPFCSSNLRVACCHICLVGPQYPVWHIVKNKKNPLKYQKTLEMKTPRERKKEIS